jgi:hypothetical protein
MMDIKKEAIITIIISDISTWLTIQYVKVSKPRREKKKLLNN